MSGPSLWRAPSYPAWLISDTANELTGALAAFAIPLIALFVTDDPAQAGVIGGVGAAVSAIASISGGVLADRYSRTRLMAAGAVVGCVIAAAFLALAAADALTFFALLVVQVLLSLRNGVFGMAGEAILKDIVPAGAIGRAQATNQARDAALNLGGAPLGGVLLAVGAWFVAAALVVCQVVAGVTAWLLRHRVPDHVQAGAPRSTGVLAEARAGFAWLFGRGDLRGVIAIIAMINLGVSAALTTVIYSLQQRGYSPVEIGWLPAGAGAAMLMGSLAAPSLITRVRTGALEVVGLAVLAASVTAIAFVDGLGGVIALLAVGTLLIPALNAGMSGYFMVAVPTALIGRASSAAGLCSAAVMPLAPLIAGFGLAWFGRDATLMFAAGLCLLAALLAVGSRALRQIPTEGEWSEHAARFARSPEYDGAPD